MPAPRNCPDELRERAVRMVFEVRAEDESHGSIARSADQLGIHREALRGWVRQAMAFVEPDTRAVTGRYANEIAEAGPEVTRAIYGDAKLRRLGDLKRAWDPHNVFHLNHNIAP